jgi:hypothetical protein
MPGEIIAKRAARTKIVAHWVRIEQPLVDSKREFDIRALSRR